MGGIFVSYRRDDSQGFAGRLADDLEELFGAEQVFRDVEIPVGLDFTEVLHRAVAGCDALLVVIGRHWQGTAASGVRSRLFEPGDWVRTEIEAALAQRKLLVPVLVGGAAMPRAEQLPDSIAALARRQAYVISDRDWQHGLQQLAAELRRRLPALAAKGEEATVAASDSPAQVLRELGDRVLDEVLRQRQAPGTARPARRRLLGWVGRLLRPLKRLAGTVVVIAGLYLALRLFGDGEVQRGLDRLESQLQAAGVRLSEYWRGR
jgi:hypothetical protein